jgi:NADPH-dependent 2,4-dienoyl-CoA reductase/sulfur reductase-like enzyme
VNPSLGREKELAVIPARTRKKVMVVGGGPAGMEAARVAALRGHEVTIYDKAHSLGGRIKLASMIKGADVENVLPIYDYLTTQIKKLGVKTRLKTEVTPALVQRERPDAVVVANSAIYHVPDIPGIKAGNVSTVKSLSEKVKLPMSIFGPKMLSFLTHLFLPVGRKVVVLGGQIEALQGAVFLKKRGRDVVVIEESETLGAGIPERFLVRMFPWFKEKGVEILTGTKCVEVTGKGVHIVSKDGGKDFIRADSVLVLMPQVPSREFADSLKPYAPEIHVIGSSLGPEHGLLKHALLDGRAIGCAV